MVYPRIAEEMCAADGEQELRDLEGQKVCLWRRIWYQNAENTGAVSGGNAMLQST